MKTTTQERAEAIVGHARSTTGFSDLTTDLLIRMVEEEIGSLDEFVEFEGRNCKAVAPDTILHVMRGMAPEIRLASLARGVLLGSRNLAVVDRDGPRFVFEEFVEEHLNTKLVETSETLHREWVDSADVVIVHGEDEVAESVGKLLRPGQRFVQQSHLVSFSVVLAEANHEDAAERAANDVCVFEEPGGTAPHCIYVEEDPRGFAACLATELGRHRWKTRGLARDLRGESEMMNMCSTYEFRETHDARVKVWKGDEGAPWAVIYEDEPQFAHSCLHRMVFVKPMPPRDCLLDAVAMVGDRLGDIGLFPFDAETREVIEPLGPELSVELGTAQNPSILVGQDGGAVLAPLVRWVEEE